MAEVLRVNGTSSRECYEIDVQLITSTSAEGHNPSRPRTPSLALYHISPMSNVHDASSGGDSARRVSTRTVKSS